MPSDQLHRISSDPGIDPTMLPAFLPPQPLTVNSPSILLTNHRRPDATIKIPKASLSSHTTLLTIPTGINASIGGYAGDALPSARLLSSVTDTLITHPNVLNGAMLYYPLPNTLYVEGYALDAFAANNLSLHPLSAPRNKVGVLLDNSLERDARIRHIQVADAARATLGLNIPHVVITDQPVGVTLSLSSGASWGCVNNPATLLRGAEELLKRGCDAIAVVTEFPDEDDDSLAAYRQGSGVDSIAGAEAVISHLLTREFRVPVAHAPSLPPLPPDDTVSPKAAAEELGYTFLSCVLVGLSRAPRLGRLGDGGIVADDVDVVVVPVDTFGGAAVMSLASRPDVLVIAVENNTAMKVSPEAVGIERGRVVTVRSYAEAAGIVAANRAGIEISALGTYVPRLEPRELDKPEGVTKELELVKVGCNGTY